MENDAPCKWKSKEKWYTILISGKQTLTKTVFLKKSLHYNKVVNPTREHTIFNIYASTIGVPKYLNCAAVHEVTRVEQAWTTEQQQQNI